MYRGNLTPKDFTRKEDHQVVGCRMEVVRKKTPGLSLLIPRSSKVEAGWRSQRQHQRQRQTSTPLSGNDTLGIC